MGDLKTVDWMLGKTIKDAFKRGGWTDYLYLVFTDGSFVEFRAGGDGAYLDESRTLDEMGVTIPDIMDRLGFHEKAEEARIRSAEREEQTARAREAQDRAEWERLRAKYGNG